MLSVFSLQSAYPFFESSKWAIFNHSDRCFGRHHQYQQQQQQQQVAVASVILVGVEAWLHQQHGQQQQ
jgi:hypothetical protein